MSALAAAARLAKAVRTASRAVGGEVVVDPARVLDRSDAVRLCPPGLWSPNRSCRMVRAADGWLAVNLPRADDRALVPAWIEGEPDAEPWPAVIRAAPARGADALVARAGLLGLPVARVGELTAGSLEVPLRRMGPVGPRPSGVIDLSALWAGPLAAGLLAAAGLRVTKVESVVRPDPTRVATPVLDARLNGGKARLAIDLCDPAARADLRALILEAGMVVTSARARALASLGLDPAELFAARPGLVWVAVTAHGWASDRVAFGDDAAAAGGLVAWSRTGRPRFAGDALADPLTGLAAVAGALRAIAQGGGVLVDAGMAQVAAGAARC